MILFLANKKILYIYFLFSFFEEDLKFFLQSSHIPLNHQKRFFLCFEILSQYPLLLKTYDIKNSFLKKFHFHFKK